MTREEAEERAKQLNAELGAAGVTDAFFIDVETSPGTWDVEKQTIPPKRFALLRELLNPFS